ncbi:voltage-dependent T-type calcium channel subunit alpha-1I-like [Leuresthes tenuis]|uniref:voltage-dependent T-type calcium channel subunit alpha-1I-like n=1 Tax=Leuresthes tenuis TaxID=355514 RepID=UPI003B50BCFB
MVAQGVYGHRGSYLADKWNKIDIIVTCGEMLDSIVFAFGIRLGVGHALKPMRLISRIQSLRDLVSILLDTLPMLGNVLILYMFVIHIFGVIGVQLWGGELHNRCFLGEDILTKYNLSLSRYFVSAPGERGPFLCSSEDLNGKRRCSDVPPYQERGKVCTLPAPPANKPGNWAVSAASGDCVNWNRYYNICRPGGPNPNMGAINFDDIGHAWIAIFQVVTLEGWTDILYYVMDTHSVWSLVLFILITIMGSFILMNTCAVVIATHFSEAMIKVSGDVCRSSTPLKVLCCKMITSLYYRMSAMLPSSNCHRRGNASLFGFWPPMRERLKVHVEGNFFTRGIMLSILLNIITMAIDHHGQPWELTLALEVCDIFFSIIFAMEMILKLLVYRKMYFAERGNLFDFAIVMISVWEVVSNSDGRLSVVRTFRVLRFGRLVHFLPYLKRQLMVLLRTMAEASTLCWLMLFYVFIFGVMGMHLFGCKFVYISQDGDPAEDRKNFDSLLWSMVTVFQVLTQEDWNMVLYNAMASTSPWAALYFVAIIMIGKNVLLNVLVGIVVESFQSQPTIIPTDNTCRPSSTLNLEDGATTSPHNNPTNRAGEVSAPTQTNWSDACLNWIQRVLRWCKERDNWAFYLLPPENKFRRFCQELICHKMFDSAIMIFILLSCITIALERPDISPDSMERWILDILSYLLTFVFFVEMFVKVMARGLIFGRNSYCQSSWNILDGTLVITSSIHICFIIVTSGKTQMLSILKVLRLLRALRPLRMIKRTPKLKLAVEALIASVKPMGNIVLICGVFFFFFGILGVQLFKGKFFHCVGEDVSNIVNKSDCLAANLRWVRKEYNFDNLLQALVSLFVMYSKDGWVNLMYDGLDAVGVDEQPIRNYNQWMLIFFIFFMVMSFFLLDMFIGVMVETFHQCQQTQKHGDDEIGRRIQPLQNNQNTHVINYLHYSKVRRIIHKVCSSKSLDIFISAIIIINVFMMAFEHHDEPKYVTKLAEYTHYGFTLIMITEVVLKIIAFGIIEFVKDSWNLLDITIVIISISSILLSIIEMVHLLPFNPSILRVCRVLRLAQVLKAKKIRVLLKTIIKTLSQVGNICLLFMFFFFIFAALGVELFGNLQCTPDYQCLGIHRHSNFRDFPMALFTLYKVCTGDNWSGILKDTMRECRPDDLECVSYLYWVSPIFFSCFVVVAQFVLANLVVAAIMQALHESSEKQEEKSEMAAHRC